MMKKYNLLNFMMIFYLWVSGQNGSAQTAEQALPLNRNLNHEMFQSIIKLGTGAMGWQIGALLYANSAILTSASTFFGFSLSTGFLACLGLISGMYCAQAILAYWFAGDKITTLKTCALQLVLSLTIADGLWQLAYVLNHSYGLGPATYFIEATVFILLQKSIHLATIRYTTFSNSFNPTPWFLVVVTGAYTGFDYIPPLFNAAFSIASTSNWTVLTSGIGTAIGASIPYLMQKAFQIAVCSKSASIKYVTQEAPKRTI